MNKFKQIRNIGKVSKQIAQTGKGIDNCPQCREHREAILKHTLAGHKNEQ